MEPELPWKACLTRRYCFSSERDSFDSEIWPGCLARLSGQVVWLPIVDVEPLLEQPGASLA